jgi:hypothetical protein
MTEEAKANRQTFGLSSAPIDRMHNAGRPECGTQMQAAKYTFSLLGQCNVPNLRNCYGNSFYCAELPNVMFNSASLLEALSVDIHSLKIQFNKTPRAVV